jgi:hypothetical protein
MRSLNQFNKKLTWEGSKDPESEVC